LLRAGTVPISHDMLAARAPVMPEHVHNTVPLQTSGASSEHKLSVQSAPIDSLADHHQYILHMKGPITQTMLLTLQEHVHPYHVLNYVPHDSVLLVGPAAAHIDYERFYTRVLSASHALYLLPYVAEYKVSTLDVVLLSVSIS